MTEGSKIVSKVWQIYWWADIGKGKKIRGSDTLTYNGDIDDIVAEDILEKNAQGLGTEHPLLLKNFADKYLNADFCLNYGVVKIKQVKENCSK